MQVLEGSGDRRSENMIKDLLGFFADALSTGVFPFLHVPDRVRFSCIQGVIFCFGKGLNNLLRLALCCWLYYLEPSDMCQRHEVVVPWRSGGRSRRYRRRIHIFDGEEICDFAEGEEGSFDGGTGKRSCDFDAGIRSELNFLCPQCVNRMTMTYRAPIALLKLSTSTPD
jgi:hypothetical protein